MIGGTLAAVLAASLSGLMYYESFVRQPMTRQAKERRRWERT